MIAIHRLQGGPAIRLQTSQITHALLKLASKLLLPG
jgi:hypothetical protein